MEELTPEDLNTLRNQPSHNYNKPQYNEYHSYAEQTRNKLKIMFNELCKEKENFVQKFHQEVEDIDCYYDSIISVIEQQRIKDKEAI